MKILIKEKDKRHWTEVESALYNAEADLQKLIADSPSIIPVEEIMDDPNPYVFSVKEYGLPGSGNTDVLLFNPNGNIGIIECKLASNSEIKRKVIGQILEYAAFLWNVSYEDLDEKVSQITGKNLVEGVSTKTDQEEWDEESFRTNIEEILSIGTFNLIIAVDHINEELRRTIDYLNECGNTAFSFHALELHKYKSDNTQMLVPHMYGKVPQSKRVGSLKKKLWTEEGFFNHAQTLNSETILDMMHQILEWAKANADRVFWGKGREYGSYTFHYRRDGKTISVFTITSQGKLVLNFGYLSERITKTQLETFHNNLVKVKPFQGIELNPKAFPSISLKELLDAGKESIETLKKAVLELLN